MKLVGKECGERSQMNVGLEDELECMDRVSKAYLQEIFVLFRAIARRRLLDFDKGSNIIVASPSPLLTMIRS